MDKRSLKNRLEDEKRGIASGGVDFDSVVGRRGTDDEAPAIDVSEVGLALPDKARLAKALKGCLQELVDKGLLTTESIRWTDITPASALKWAMFYSTLLGARVTTLTQVREEISAGIKAALGDEQRELKAEWDPGDGGKPITLTRYTSSRESIVGQLLLDQGILPSVIKAATKTTPTDTLRIYRQGERGRR